MDITTAVILGIIEGITEFLPVSSTGHMILAGHFLDANTPKWHVFEVFIQLGAILAVVYLYWNRFILLLDFSKQSPEKQSFRGTQGIIKLFVGCLPAFVLGALLHSKIKEHLFSPATVILALIVGAFLMLWIERRDNSVSATDVNDLTLMQCLKIGFFQCLALWPGMSRSASTIIGAMLVGANRTVAAEFSFLLAVPTMCAAVGYDLLKSYSLLSSEDLLVMAIGFVVSFFTAMLAVKMFVSFLQRSTLNPFAYYRIVIGVALAIVLY